MTPRTTSARPCSGVRLPHEARPRQHDALGRFLAAIFDTPPENAASQHYDRMRRDRNRQRYSATPIATAAATTAADAATTLFRAGRTRARAGA